MAASRHEIHQAQTLEQLKALEKKHGYEFGWANKIYNFRQQKKAA